MLSPMVQPAQGRGMALLTPFPARSQSGEKGAEGTCQQQGLLRDFFPLGRNI